MRQRLVGGGVLAALWFAFGWVPHLLYLAGGRIAALSRLVPMPMHGVHGSPLPWAVLVQVLTVCALVAGFALVTAWFDRGRGTLASSWLAAIVTALAIGVALDLGYFFSSVGTLGLRGAATNLGVTSEPMVFWAVLVGWIPAIVVLVRTRSGHPGTPPHVISGARAGDTTARGIRSPHSSQRRARGMTHAMLAPALVAALVALPFAAEAGHAATQEQLRQAEIEAGALADPDGAADRDPDATGEPVPTAAPAEGVVPGGACGSENTTILAPVPDAATGHRAQTLSLVNVSDEPCTVNGYPDVAYGDQNAHLLDVTIEQGGSFMAQDPGASPITLQPGEAAVAVVGWNANSVHGQLAARQLWAAVRPGADRLAWDVSLDIIPGTTVQVTAWQESETPSEG